MLFQHEYYTEKAIDLQQRERKIKAARGEILDRNGVVLATNEPVCTISVIHNQIKDKEQVIRVLCEELDLSEEYVRKRVEKVSSIEKIKSNVSKESGKKILEYQLDGVKVDEDYKRVYPYNELASKVIGFTGGDNQGIIGLESKYESTLKGEDGTILTFTDSWSPTYLPRILISLRPESYCPLRWDKYYFILTATFFKVTRFIQSTIRISKIVPE